MSIHNKETGTHAERAPASIGRRIFDEAWKIGTKIRKTVIPLNRNEELLRDGRAWLRQSRKVVGIIYSDANSRFRAHSAFDSAESILQRVDAAISTGEPLGPYEWSDFVMVVNRGLNELTHTRNANISVPWSFHEFR